MLTHSQALVLTVLPTGIFNYFMLKKTWRGAPAERNSDMMSHV